MFLTLGLVSDRNELIISVVSGSKFMPVLNIPKCGVSVFVLSLRVLFVGRFFLQVLPKFDFLVLAGSSPLFILVSFTLPFNSALGNDPILLLPSAKLA